MTPDALAPCPFCGSDEDTIVDGTQEPAVKLLACRLPFEEDYMSGRRVECAICGAHGPPQETAEEAAFSWGERKVKAS